MTSASVKVELERLIPIKQSWVIQENGDNQFIMPFPNKVKLQRMITIRDINTEDGESTFKFDEWTEKIQHLQFLQKVWINVYGVPFEIRNYLSLWTVGSILCATQMVDMVSTRITCVVRLMVGVTDATHIPRSINI